MKTARFSKPHFHHKKFKKKGSDAPFYSKTSLDFADETKIRLYGSHSVEAALRNPQRKILRLLATENATRRLSEVLSARDIKPEATTPRELDRILGSDTVHQGLLLETEPLPEPEIELLASQILTKGPLLLLDQVTDPHNVGAILRSAAAFGAAGLIMTRRHSPPLNGTLAKSASGALEIIPIALVQNLARTLSEIKDMNVEIIGLDSDSTHTLEEESFQKPTALVLGAESKGLRQLTAESCHHTVRISTAEALHSLNVSNAAAIALHSALLKRK
ncbi:MAG: 23S rRNA (guanosine(2251)-2'-O)-methyltransferase RlmB [Hyphomicrobium sp.]